MKINLCNGTCISNKFGRLQCKMENGDTQNTRMREMRQKWGRGMLKESEGEVLRVCGGWERDREY